MALPPLKFPIRAEDKTAAAFRSLRGRVNAAKRSFGGIGPIIRGAFAVTAVTSFGAALGGALGTARDFGKAMDEVSTLLPDKSQMAELTKQVKAQSVAFGRAPVGQAKALYQIISAGASSAARATEILTASNKLAIGGVTEIATAADGLTTALNAYGDQVESATDVSDAMFVAMKAGKTTIGELSSSLGKVAPIASTAGVGFEELLAATAALTKQGISTSESMNGLRAIIAAILKPSSEAEKMAAKLGLKFNAQALAAKGLAGFMADLREKTGGSVEVMAQLFGGVEALNPVLALTGNGAADFAAILEDMGRKAGATEAAFEKMSSNADFQLKRLSAAITITGNSIGEALLPPMAAVAEYVANNFPRGIDRITRALKTMRDLTVTTGQTILKSQARVAEAFADTNNMFAGVEVAGFGEALRSAAGWMEGLKSKTDAAAPSIQKLNAEISKTKLPVAPVALAAKGVQVYKVDPLAGVARRFLDRERKKAEALQKTTDGLRRQAEQQRQLTAVLGQGSEQYKRLKNEIDLQNEATRLNIDLTTQQGARWLEAARQAQVAGDGLAVATENQQMAIATIQDGVTAVSSTLSTAISDVVLYGKTWGDVAKGISASIFESLIQSLVDAGVKMAANFAIAQTFGAATAAAAVAEGAVVASAWAPAAAFTSLATFGANAVPAAAALTSTAALSQGLALIPRERGGPVTAGKGYLVGERGAEPFFPGVSGTIVPNDAAFGDRGGNAGPVTVNFNITTLNAQGFNQMLMNSRGVIAGIIRDATRDVGRRPAF